MSEAKKEPPVALPPKPSLDELSASISKYVASDLWQAFQDRLTASIYNAAAAAVANLSESKDVDLWAMVQRHLERVKENVEKLYKEEIKTLKKEIETLKSNLEKEKASSAKKDEVNNTLRELVKKKKEQTEKERDEEHFQATYSDHSSNQ